MASQLEALEEALRTRGAVLQQRGTPYSILVGGGGSLLLLRLIDRPTGDLDVVALAEKGVYRKIEALPAPLATAAAQVAQVARALELADTWLNTAPASMMDFGLPSVWEDQISVRAYGALEVHISSRFDLICFKLYAAVDRGPNDKHYSDLQELQPTADELTQAARWTITHDPSEVFRNELLGCLASLGVEVSDGDL
ncbi:MAG: DUF6036 family nucleotidyltransferase [Acidimicrobiales bacterium]